MKTDFGWKYQPEIVMIHISNAWKYDSRDIILQIHTKKDTITINGTIPIFEEKYPGLFLRIHASYLINPAHVREIRRFSVSLADGTELPIPEKKYTRIKKLLLQEGQEKS